MRTFVKAARLRTLPLAVSAIAMGDSCARVILPEQHRTEITVWVLLTAVLLQILSNFANDYGDFKKGTDLLAERTDRALASGALSEKQMLSAIITVSVFALMSGLVLLSVSFSGNFSQGFVFMLVVGLLAIAAAITYTVGKRAYGYNALGDLFVFLFFGLVAVTGCVYLHAPGAFFDLPSHHVAAVVAASLSMGFAATAVLTINNIRDREKDKKAGKTTLPVLLGFRKAKTYYLLLVSGMLLCFILFGFYTEKKPGILLLISLVSSLVFGYRLFKIFATKPDTPFAYYSRELKLFSLSVLILPLLAWL